MQMAIRQEYHGEAYGDDEERQVPDVGFPPHFKLANQGHGSSYHGGDEARRADQLSNRHAGAVRAHGREGAEDVRGAIAKGQEGDAGETLAKAQNGRDGVEIDAEEIAGGDANGGEEQAEPTDKDNEGQGLGFAKVTVVKRQVREEASLIISAVSLDKGALVVGAVDVATFCELGSFGEG
ncbi:hypothetical protein Ct61P_01085 [Colletotrichum tofieldiae]|nr:hypothetical protein Ct61P_01085 [Colletotrichum tofieldiae]